VGLEGFLEAEGREPCASALVELVLELYPVQPERVQEALHGVHAHQHEYGEGHEEDVCEKQLKRSYSLEMLTIRTKTQVFSYYSEILIV